MAKVVPPDARDIAGQSPEALPVSGLEVGHANRQPTLFLEVAVQGGEYERSGREQTIRLALSLPAATQLSRLLKQAVKNYLRSEPDQKNQK